MPDPPDFEEMADRIISRAITIYRHAIFPNASAEKDRAALIDDLRQVWNARGAADQEAIGQSLNYLVILAKAKEPPDLLAQIRALDR